MKTYKITAMTRYNDLVVLGETDNLSKAKSEFNTINNDSFEYVEIREYSSLTDDYAILITRFID